MTFPSLPWFLRKHFNWWASGTIHLIGAEGCRGEAASNQSFACPEKYQDGHNLGKWLIQKRNLQLEENQLEIVQGCKLVGVDMGTSLVFGVVEIGESAELSRKLESCPLHYIPTMGSKCCPYCVPLCLKVFMIWGILIWKDKSASLWDRALPLLVKLTKQINKRCFILERVCPATRHSLDNEGDRGSLLDSYLLAQLAVFILGLWF